MQACGQPEPSISLLRCQQQCGWDSLLALHQFYPPYAAPSPAAAVIRTLHAHLQSRAVAILPTLTRSATSALHVLPAAHLHVSFLPSIPSHSPICLERVDSRLFSFRSPAAPHLSLVG